MAVRHNRSRDLARLGASVRLGQIAAERTTVLEIFADLPYGLSRRTVCRKIVFD